MYCDGSLDEGEYTVEALMLSRGQGESRKTFSRPAGLNDTFSILGPNFCFYAGLVRTFSILRPWVLFPSGIMSTFFHSFWVWHALFLFWDPIFASIRVWHAIFLLWNFAFSFYQPRIPICLTILHTFFNTASYLFHIYPVS